MTTEALLHDDSQPDSQPEVVQTDQDNNSEASQQVVTGPIPLRMIHVVSDHIPAIEASKKKIIAEMESMVVSGLAELVGQPLQKYLLPSQLVILYRISQG